EASRHLGKSAALALAAEQTAVAEALWRESLDVERDNPISIGAFGRFLCERDRFPEAIPYLREATLPWSAVELAWCNLALALGGPESADVRERAAEDLITQLVKAAGDVEKQTIAGRTTWVSFVKKLARSGTVTEDRIVALVTYANEWAKWREVDISEVQQKATSR
ncbi:MAG: hypothetical protein ACYDHO_08260, partial [Gaiellaceae bacterium]